MKSRILAITIAAIGLAGLGIAYAAHHEPLIENALSAAPATITANATVKDGDGNVLRQGNNGWTCYPQAATVGPMCNRAQWDAALGAMMNKQPIDITEFSVSYMLAGEGTAIGVSNIDPYAAAPTADNNWIKDGPHLMILVPDAATLEGLSTDPKDPVYVMWKGTDYAHIMVRVSEEE